MRIVIAKLITERDAIVGVPEGVEIETLNREVYIVKPGSGVDGGGPKILLTPTDALHLGLLVELPEAKAGSR